MKVGTVGAGAVGSASAVADDARLRTGNSCHQSEQETGSRIVPRIRSVAPETLILVVTDPPDPLAAVVRMLGHDRVLSTGTFLDSLRFRFHLARRFKVNPADAEAQVIGEHGTSECFLMVVGTRGIADRQIESLNANERVELERDVRYANITAIEGIGASQYGIGIVSARIEGTILRDERAVIPIGSTFHKMALNYRLQAC